MIMSGIMIGTVKNAFQQGKGFIIRTSFYDSNGKNTYKLMSVNNFTKGNAFDSFNGFSLPGLIKEILKNGNFNVYEFDTPQALFKWLTE